MLLGQRTEPQGDGAPGHDTDAGGWSDLDYGHRAEIQRATGMVVVQLGISAADAVARLRGYAFVHRRLLLDVARDVVERRLVFTEEMT